MTSEAQKEGATLSIVREVETEGDANLKRAQALRQATLAKAFSFASNSASMVV